jgi:hypothetical protein
MPTDIGRIPTFFAAWIAAHGSAGPCGEVATWLSTGELDPSTFNAIIARHGVTRETWFRTSMLDLVLDYARERLSEGLLTLDDIADIQLLKRALHVSEGEFVNHRPAEVSAFLQLALDGILADDRIDEYEELYLVTVQAAFDLSYDQFLTLGRAALERAISSLDLKRAIAERRDDGATVRGVDRKRAALEPVYWLTSRQRRSLGALY